ncbi:MAG: tRNA lysidine(34) synthetase TilS [Schleiferiaceae bacterium]|nr:tRNA lysidine(34) synthetase TilS [Schleiferiaceae bacterium]
MNRLEHHIKEYLSEEPEDARAYLLFCSGGQDSMVLAHALHVLGISFEILHVHYGLRGEASDEDAAFVAQWAANHSVEYHQRRVQSDFGNDSDLQARARHFRYAAGREILQQRGLQAILAAQHADDAAETFLFHAARGTGLDGLLALAPRSGDVIRPLYHLAKADIIDYAEKNRLSWREDASNAEDKYTRNHLRHHALPALREAMPQANSGLQTTLRNLRELQAFVDASITRESVLYLGPSKSVPGAKVLYRDVLDHPHSSVIVWYILRNYGAFDFDAVHALSSSQVGSMLEKGGWQLWAEREGLLLRPTPCSRDVSPVALSMVRSSQLFGPFWDGMQWQPDHLWTMEPKTFVPGADLGSLASPVLSSDRCKSWQWRLWMEGDFIYPLGMKGRKKLSDVLTEGKLPAMYRKELLVLAVDAGPGEVYWVPGLRLSRRVAVVSSDSCIWRIQEDASKA